MPQRQKSGKKKRPAVATEKPHEPGSAARHEAGPRAWAAANKHQGGNKKISSRAKVPFGPVGGLGRKTNQARSS